MMIDRDFVLRIVQVAFAFFGLSARMPKFYNWSASITCFFFAIIIQLVIVILDSHDEANYYSQEENDDEE